MTRLCLKALEQKASADPTATAAAKRALKSFLQVLAKRAQPCHSSGYVPQASELQ
ncbi:unnamed protein product, partial [Polarella glacialis]